VALLAASAMAAESEYLIASWENTMNHFGTGTDFDSAAFTTFDGVTNGSTALELDVKTGWTQGLRTAYVDGLNPDFAPFFPQLEGAQKLRLDVTTSNGLANVPMSSGIQLNLMIQGQSGNGTPAFATTSYGYKLIMGVYNQAESTETIEWDLTKDGNGAPVALLPAFSTSTGGWFDMRININCIGNPPNPGIIVLDNLRAVKGGTTPHLGDFNNDKVVNQADYTTWADHFGGNVTSLSDGSFDVAGGTTINQSHYTTWADNFGKTYSSSVPEPATMSLLVLGALGLIRRRR